MHKQSISLVLGSGGARGLAHIGVIERLVASGYEIRSIAGSSMGALIGGIYATGKLDVYAGWVNALERRDVLGLLDLSFGRNGLFKGERIIDTLRTLIGDQDIEDLPIKFTAVATDMESEQEVRLNDGPLFDAIRASIAIPSIFTPHAYRGRQYLDGSLVNPIPISATLDDDTDLTVAVNLSARPDGPIKVDVPGRIAENGHRSEYRQGIAKFVDDLRQRLDRATESTPGMMDVIAKSINIVTNALAQAQIANFAPDIVVEIPRNICTFYEFHRAREMIEIGRRHTDEALKRFHDG